MKLLVSPVSNRISLQPASKHSTWGKVHARVHARKDETAGGGGEKRELATISHEFSFPPRKPRDTAKRENCHHERAVQWYLASSRRSRNENLWEIVASSPFLRLSLARAYHGSVGSLRSPKWRACSQANLVMSGLKFYCLYNVSNIC